MTSTFLLMVIQNGLAPGDLYCLPAILVNFVVVDKIFIQQFNNICQTI